MNFREGSFVRAGTVLYRIDRKPLEAVVAAAKADQATAEAELGTAEARLAKTNNDVARYTPLAAKQAVSQQELDDARAAQDAARSEVRAARSQIEAAKAAVEKATFDVGYTNVTAPIGGLVGTSLVKPGTLVGRGENTLLTTISQIDPVLFRVGATEADYLRVARRDPSRSGAAPSAGGIQLTLTDGTVYPHTGRVVTVDRAVDPATGTLGLQIEFPNPEQLLRPGQFGRLRVLIDTRTNALLVPQRAVQELQNLYSVAVVDEGGKVAFRTVKVGPRVDALWVINEGVKAVDRVVAEGLQRIRDGMTVTPKPAPEPAATGGPGKAAATGAEKPAAGEK
jgi:membrane fusion protein (multidrug efflux system)